MALKGILGDMLLIQNYLTLGYYAEYCYFLTYITALFNRTFSYFFPSFEIYQVLLVRTATNF
jgi:hypothetical protein